MSAAPTPQRPDRRSRPLRALWSTGTGAFALSVLTVLTLAAVVSFFWLPHNPAAADAYRAWQPPNTEFWLGTDGSGRDIFSRLVFGSRITLLIAVGAGLLAGLIGLVLATAGGLGGRWVREPIAVLIDVLVAFPTLIIAMMLSAAFGSGIPVLIA
ncbi:ABC transporter permease, partial [Leucobacter sp. M11]|uniref:ABC transporter permease n=1 Tax=Leucobacter sp. M11 TaxID=2993565 RepID=UPI002DA41E98|nr:ABC transporter permease [Leucobacter sp. M11]